MQPLATAGNEAAAAHHQRRGALVQSSSSLALHWTKSLTGENATTRMGARFHLRKLFLRSDVDEFSQCELEFIVQYLVHETTIAEQPWWAALTHYERLEVVNSLELHHTQRDEEHTLWFSAKDTAKDCILIYGSAEAKPMDCNLAPVLKFTEGSVVGNMKLHTPAPGTGSATDSSSLAPLPTVVASANASAQTWRRVKREQAFRNGLHHYNKLVISGPADYFILTSSHIMETTSRAAERVEREQLLKLFGLERFLGVIRKKTFDAGSFLAREGEQLQSLFIIVEGECRASVRVDSAVDVAEDVDEYAEKTLSNGAMGKGAKETKLKSRQLPIASLGPRSIVGDVSMMLGANEPATIQAATAVTVLTLAQEDFLTDSGDMRDPKASAPIDSMKVVALDTLEFVAERTKTEAAYQQCDARKLLGKMERNIAERKLEIEGLRTRLQSGPLWFTRPSRYESLQPPQGDGKMIKVGQQVVPSVVQKYVETVASRSSRGGGLGPVILSKRYLKGKASVLLGEDYTSTAHLTREQRRAALVLNGLHSPLGTKSLGQLLHPTHQTISSPREEEDDNKNKESRSLASSPESRRKGASADNDQLFLFPTMTKQRQLHARSLPLLPRYRGLDGNNR